MKLLRFGAPGEERPGAIDASGTIRDPSSVVFDIDPSTLGPQDLDALRAYDLTTLPAVSGDVCMGPCRRRWQNGMHRSQLCGSRGRNVPIPAEPIIFMKATSAITDPTTTSSSLAVAPSSIGKSNSVSSLVRKHDT